MKLSKIKKAMRRKTLDIVTEAGGNQWLGDGTAFYLVDSGLDLTAGNIMAILDIDEDKRDEYTVRELTNDYVAMCDMVPQEGCDEELRPMVSVSWAGELVTIMRTEDGEAVAIPQRQIEPADGREPLRFFMRKSVRPETGEICAPVVACFQDMLCCAVIMPMRAKVVNEMWAAMRAGSAERLTYCVEEQEEGEQP